MTQGSDLLHRARAGRDAAKRLQRDLVETLRDTGAALFAPEGQRALHGFAWLATNIVAIDATVEWAGALVSPRPADLLVVRILVGEYCAQILGGIPMSQSEIVRPSDLGAGAAAARFGADPAVAWLINHGNSGAARRALAELLLNAEMPSEGLGDPELEAIRDQIRAFTAAEITPHAHGWHLRDELIPSAIVADMAALGIFGLTVPAEHGGLGLGKLAMCIVSEELSRGWICAGSLGTRSEIAAELILHAGTEGQKARWLPSIASGAVLPTAVFTEPDHGSDLANLKTSATRLEGGFRVQGVKTWITHAGRADLMTMLVRTEGVAGHGGLSILLAPKPRMGAGLTASVDGLTMTEIEVLGYRGMKEHTLFLDGFEVAEDCLLGGTPGQGFKQLMHTFESARIQTAARAVGVALSALDVALAYASERRQFGHPIAHFARIADKLAMMAAEVIAARAMTHRAASAKDSGRRCDVEAGMAKLLAARIAWANADAAVQIHGGNGYALEFPVSRILCDARILSIFEGAAEIQANIIGKRLLSIDS